MAIPNQILIDSPTNTISIQTNDNQLHIISPVCNTEVNVTQPSTTVVQVATPGPQGPQGPQGPAGPSGSFVSTGSFATTSSNIFSGNQIITGSLNVSEGITGSLFGTSSYSLNAISASYAQTASYINPLTQNVIITGSLTVSGSNTFINIGPAIFSGSVSTNEGFTGSLQGTSSYSSQALSASFASTASLAPDYVLINATGSMSVATASFAQTASYVQNAQTASYVQNTISASYAQTASYVNTLNQNVLITGSLTVLQGATIYGSSSFVYVTASQLAVSASYISVNVFEPAQRFGGLYVFDSGSSNATASLTWDSLNNHWVYTNSSDSSYTGGGLISGPKNTGSLGQETYPTQNRIVKGQGGDHIMDSNITDTGTIVSINSDTQITGSLIISGSTNHIGNVIITGSLTTNDGVNVQTITASIVSASQFTGSLFGTASYALNAQGSTGDIQFRGSTAGTLASSALSGYFTWLETNNNSGNKRSGSLNIGPPVPNGQSLSNNPLSISHNINDYAQMNMQNLNSGNAASSDIIATANNGSDTTYYVDLGINSSTYNQAAYNIGGANDSYLVNVGGNLTIGTDSTKDLIFHTNGSTTANERMRITSTGVTKITGSLVITGSLTTNDGVNVQTITASIVSSSQFTGSLFGTSSWANNATSASFASTASLAPNYVLTSTTSSMLAPYVLTSATSSMLTPYVLTSATSSMLTPYVLTSATSSMLAPYVLTSVTSSMSVATASYALNATGYDPLTTQHFMQDFAFDNSQASTGGYAVGTNGGSGQGGALLTSHAYTNALGIFRLTSGTTAATGLGLISNGAVAFNWKPSMFALTSVDRINLSAASDATNRYTTRVGFFTQTYNSEPTAGVYFRYTDNTNSGKWQCVCRSASTETVINTTVSPTITPSWQKMEFRCNDAGTSVEFFIDNVSQGSITTNIPTTTYLLKIIVLNKITGSSSQLMDIDYYYTKTTRTL